MGIGENKEVVRRYCGSEYLFYINTPVKGDV